MIVISPACTNARVSLQSSHIGEVVRSIGTERYSKACFDVFEQPLEVNTWLLMRYSRDNSVRCVANASRSYALAVSEAIDRFVAGFYSVDPSLLAFRAQRLQSDCVVKIEIGDIRDRQYRYCYNQTHAQERLSFFHGVGFGSLPAERVPQYRQASFLASRYYKLLSACWLHCRNGSQTRELQTAGGWDSPSS